MDIPMGKERRMHGDRKTYWPLILSLQGFAIIVQGLSLDMVLGNPFELVTIEG